MDKVCPKCGLTKDLCICETLAKEKETIKVFFEKKRYGKAVTFVEGISKDANVKNILKELKRKLACGGTVKDGVLELQGDHRQKAKNILIRLGFPAEQIEVH